MTYVCKDGMKFDDDISKASISRTCLEGNTWSAIDWTDKATQCRESKDFILQSNLVRTFVFVYFLT